MFDPYEQWLGIGKDQRPVTCYQLLGITATETNAKAIEKAIQAANIGLNPNVSGRVIRLFLPELSTERRQELVKVGKKMAEDNRIAIRNERRQAIEALKKLKKDGHISEDDIKGGEEEVQKLTDQYIKKIDDHLAHKEHEIMKV